MLWGFLQGGKLRFLGEIRLVNPPSLRYNKGMEKTIEQLERIIQKLDEMIGIMKKPENKLLRILEIIGNVVTIVSVLAIVEIIRNWT